MGATAEPIEAGLPEHAIGRHDVAPLVDVAFGGDEGAGAFAAFADELVKFFVAM